MTKWYSYGLDATGMSERQRRTVSDDLKPCPFCGGSAEIVDARKVLGVWRLIHRCKNVGYINIEHPEKDAAVKRWNTRADSKRIAALEAAIDDIDLIANAVRSEYDGSPADIALAVHMAIKGRLTDTGENRE